jgi:hypothetical protein
MFFVLVCHLKTLLSLSSDNLISLKKTLHCGGRAKCGGSNICVAEQSASKVQEVHCSIYRLSIKTTLSTPSISKPFSMGRSLLSLTANPAIYIPDCILLYPVHSIAILHQTTPPEIY